MKRKKILFFHFDLGNGGAERVLVNLANSLDSNRYEIEIRTIFDNGPNRELICDNIKYSSVFHCKQFRGISPLLQLLSPKFLHRLFVKEKYDVEIAFREGCPSRIISGGSSEIKKYSWIHTTLKSEDIATRGYRSLKEFRECSKRFRKIAAVSRNVCESVKTWIPDYPNLDVVYNVIDPSEIKNKAKEPIDVVLNHDNCINLVTVGRLTAVKAFDRLIKCLNILKNKGVYNWHLYIIGVGEQSESLHKQTTELELDNYVTFLGYQSNPHKYVSKMDLYVCSSLIEGYSTSVTESIVNQIPVLTTECAGMDEILSDSGAGMIVENSDKGLLDGLECLLTSVNSLKDMKSSAIERSKFFSKENSIKQFEQFIFNE